MTKMQGKTMAMPADGTMIHSSPGRLSWYFAQRAMPGLVYAATMNGYVASDPYKTKGGKENV
jgi:hypothetical protein